MIQIEAVPDSSSPVGSNVVLAICPLIGDLSRVFGQETEKLPVAALDTEGDRRRLLFQAEDGGDGGVVDEFWVIVSIHFAEILLDVFHFFLVIFVLLVPWRTFELVIALSESECHSAWRDARECYDMYADSKQCLLKYRSSMVPLMNSL